MSINRFEEFQKSQSSTDTRSINVAPFWSPYPDLHFFDFTGENRFKSLPLHLFMILTGDKRVFLKIIPLHDFTGENRFKSEFIQKKHIEKITKQSDFFWIWLIY